MKTNANEDSLRGRFRKYREMIASPDMPDYRQAQLANNLSRFGIASRILIVLSLVMLLIYMRLPAKQPIDSRWVWGLFLGVSVLGTLVFPRLSRLVKSQKAQWLFCYLFAVAICCIQFLEIMNVTVNKQPTFPFIILVSLLVILPDFKPTWITLIIVALYAATMLIQLLWMPLSMLAANKIINITVFTLIAVFTNLFISYNSLRVYLKERQLRRMNEHLTLTSTIDELTDLPNRRSFNYFYSNIWTHCQRLKLPLCIFMIDIDRFKQYNDSFGHLKGDETLQKVAAQLNACLKRDTDFVARYGGEEFIAIVPYVEEAEARQFAQFVVKQVEALHIQAPPGESAFLTISIGAALVVPQVGISKEKLIENADRALYEAKRNGRNQAVFCSLECEEAK